MKHFYQRLHVSFLFSPIAKNLFLVTLASLALSMLSFSQELIFKNPVLHAGIAGKDHAVYRFPRVKSNVDALVKIKKRSSSSVVLQNIDVVETGFDKAFQPQIGLNGGIVSGIKDWWMEFEIWFVKTNTTYSTSIGKFNLTSLDVDGDGYTIREYAEIYEAKSYLFENNTLLAFTLLKNGDDDDDDNGNYKNYRFTGPVKNYLDIDTLGTPVMVTCKFENKTKITVRIGAKSTGVGTSNAAIRYNSMYFRAFAYDAAVLVPVKLGSFTTKVSDGKVLLSWATQQEQNFSHFTVERSINGIDFTDAGIIFSEGNSEVVRQYSFADPIRSADGQVLHYRLKMVDMDGRVERSAVQTIRIKELTNHTVKAYPNPFTRQIQVEIPAEMQTKKVRLELYNRNGVLVKAVNIAAAANSETIQTIDLPAGAYLLKVISGRESRTQKIIKSN